MIRKALDVIEPSRAVQRMGQIALSGRVSRCHRSEGGWIYLTTSDTACGVAVCLGERKSIAVVHGTV